jgi:hypothetical protein
MTKTFSTGFLDVDLAADLLGAARADIDAPMISAAAMGMNLCMWFVPCELPRGRGLSKTKRNILDILSGIDGLMSGARYFTTYAHGNQGSEKAAGS